MKSTIKKAFLSLALSASLLMPSMPVWAELPNALHTETRTQQLAPGVTHQTIRRLTSQGWFNINVIRIDRTASDIEISGLTDKSGIYRMGRVADMVKDQKALVGINADFFDPPYSTAIGTMIEDGKLVTATGKVDQANQLPVFTLNKDGRASIGYLHTDLTLRDQGTGKSFDVAGYNKLIRKDKATYITVLDRQWREKSPGNVVNPDVLELVVVNNIVQEIRNGKEPVTIPENGFVVSVSGPEKYGLDSVQQGTTLTLENTYQKEVDNLDFAIGGGSIILQDGKIVNTNINIQGRHPRSAVGVSSDEKTVFLVTVDGRHNSYAGITQEELGELMRSLGAWNAMNLDGGGSTNLAVRYLGTENSVIVNKPSEKGRKVINGIGVFNHAVPTGKLNNMELRGENQMFIYTSMDMRPKGWDDKSFPVVIPKENVRYSVEGVEGTVTDGIFKPTSEGDAVITAQYQGFVATKKIKVLGNVVHLIAEEKNLYVENGKDVMLPKFIGYSPNGESAVIPPSNLAYDLFNEPGYVDYDRFIGSEKPKSGVLNCKFGKGSVNLHIMSGTVEQQWHSFDSMNNMAAKSYPEEVTSEISITNQCVEGKGALKLKYDFTKGKETRAAYLEIGKEEGVRLPGNPIKMSMNVFGDNNNAWLRGLIVDADGKEHYLDFVRRIDWTGWERVSADIPKSVVYPISIKKIYPVEVDAAVKYSGELLFDKLSMHYAPVMPKMQIPKESEFSDTMNAKVTPAKDALLFKIACMPESKEKEGVPAEFINRFLTSVSAPNTVFLTGLNKKYLPSFTGKRMIDGQTYNQTYTWKDVLMLNLDASKNSLAKSLPAQWETLNSLFNFDQKNIILNVNREIIGAQPISDKLEAELFHRIISKLASEGRHVFVVQKGKSPSYILKDGVRYITVSDNVLEGKEKMNAHFLNLVISPDGTANYWFDFIQ